MSTQDDRVPTGGPPTDKGGQPVDQPVDQPVGEAAGPSAAEFEDRWRRAVAEVENTRKRCSRQIEDERHAERARVAAQFLPVLDNLERALEHAPSTDDPVVAGVRAVRDQAVEMLARLGFPRHDETAVPFDPYLHEAVGVVTDPELPEGVVAQVVRPGYGDGGRQLRPAAVLVAAAGEG